MAKATARTKIQLRSTGKTKEGKETGYFKTTIKNSRNTTTKLELKKYDPRAYNPETKTYGMVVTFKEKKIPK